MIKHKITIIILLLLLIIVPGYGSAETASDNIVHQGISGDMKWWITDNGALYIEGNGEFEQTGAFCFFTDKYGREHEGHFLVLGYQDYSDEIISAHVKVSGCTSLCGLLADLKNLKTVDFKGSDTSKVANFAGLFSGQYYEEEIDGTIWMKYRSSLESVDLSDLDTSSAIDMCQMFFNCSELEEIDVSGWDTSNVTDMASMFDCCHKLKRIKGIENLDTTNVREMYLMFQQNDALEELDLSKWNTSSLTNMWSCFSGCGSSVPLSGKLRILNKNIYCDGAFKYALQNPESNFELSYVEGYSNKEELEKIASTADQESEKINITEITDPEITLNIAKPADANHPDVIEEIIPGVPATCTEFGLTEGKKCSICGEILTYQETIPPLDHDWGDGVITKEPTTTESGVITFTCRRCGETEKESIPKKKESVNSTAAPSDNTPTTDPAMEMAPDGTAMGAGASSEAAEAALTSTKGDKDLKGSVYNKLQLKQSKVTKTSITMTWKKISGAKKYIIFAGKSGKSNKLQKITTTTKTKYTLKKFNKKKLTKGTYYKFAIVALDSKGKVVTASKFAHVATLGKNAASNPAKLTTKAENDKVTVKVKKSFKLAGTYASSAKKYKIKKILGMRYESTNTKVATVSSKGIIKGIKKGTCYVYAYAQNGLAKKIKVTVKK